MKRMTAATFVAGLVMAAALIVFGWTLVHALWYAPDGSPTGAVVAATSSDPTRLVIPALNISANVQYVGVNAQGNMRAPDNFTDVAWYDPGVVPGQLGSAVIDGHVDNGLGLDGVFKHLQDIAIGNDVYVVDKNGVQLHFKVVDIETYPYENTPANTIFGRTDTARLNLITCEGVWVPSGDTYDHRLVVYTELQKS